MCSICSVCLYLLLGNEVIAGAFFRHCLSPSKMPTWGLSWSQWRWYWCLRAVGLLSVLATQVCCPLWPSIFQFSTCPLSLGTAVSQEDGCPFPGHTKASTVCMRYGRVWGLSSRPAGLETSHLAKTNQFSKFIPPFFDQTPKSKTLVWSTSQRVPLKYTLLRIENYYAAEIGCNEHY